MASGIVTASQNRYRDRYDAPLDVEPEPLPNVPGVSAC